MDNQSRKLPIILAAGIIAAVTVWMLSGLGSTPAASTVDAPRATSGASAQQVRSVQLSAHEITREISVSGRTQPNRYVSLRAEAEGIVEKISAERGSTVSANEAIVTLALRDREGQLEEAKALVKQRELEQKAIQNLRGQQFTTEVQIAEASAKLASAISAQQRIEQEISNLQIKAPFDGVVQDRSVELGDFIRIGDSVADIVDLDPVIIVGELNEQEVGHIKTGGTGTAILADGTRLIGTIRYMSQVADSATRTFQVELAVSNPDNDIRGGLTAELQLQADRIRVHTISSALLSLADDGTIGVKVVDAQDTVQFYPVEIVGSTVDGMHVTGLPDNIRLITVGQGFVVEGQKVQTLTSSSAQEML